MRLACLLWRWRSRLLAVTGNSLRRPRLLRAVVGELDEEKDASIDWDSVKGTPLPPVTH